MKRMMCTWVGIMLVLTTTMAQEKNTNELNRGKLYLLTGVQYVSLSNLNKELKVNGFPEIRNFQSYYGYGGCWQSGNWIFGGEGYFMASGEEGDQQSQDDIHISTRSGMGYFYLGYSVLNSERFYLTPKLGIGGSGMDVQINHKAETNLDNIFSNNYSNNITTGGALIHSGVKIGFIWGQHWGFNVDVGYNYGIANDWNIANGSLTESVKDGIGGAFAQISLGYLLNVKR